MAEESGTNDDSLIDITVPFAAGQWLPGQLSINVGLFNFTKLENCRYTDSGIEGISGYSKINTSPLSTYTNIRNGVQLTTNFSIPSYVLVHAKDSSGNGQIFINTADIPNQGNFTSTALHTDAPGAGAGRFSQAPGGNIVYCNGVETYIWGGNETSAEGFYTCDDSSGTNPKDFSVEVKNTLYDSSNLAIISSTQKYWMVLTTRPIQAVKYVIETENTSASTTTGKYWNGTTFAAVSNWNDGTASGGISLAQNGTMSFDSTVNDARPYHFEGAYLYAYLFNISAVSGDIEISHVTVDMPWQPIVDVWDRVPRECMVFQAYRTSTSSYSDYTYEINELSSIYSPRVATIGNMTSSDHALLMFSDRTTAIKFTMLADKTNTNAATMTVKYWNGRTWVSVSGLNDGTSNGGKSLNQSGLVSWMPPDEGMEFPKTEFGETGYFYRLSWDATLINGESGDGTSVDLVTGIPAQKKMSTFKFAAMYKNRLFLCNDEAGKEPNAVEFSLPSTSDVWNGDLTSDGGTNRIYFGGDEPLTCATEIYNRYGADVRTQFVVFKKDKIYILNGDSPDNFEIFTVSNTVGCPAPLTLASAETGFEMVSQLKRNVCFFLSYSGPMRFDGAVLAPLPGVENYFDPTSDDCINFSAIDEAYGWYDSTFLEYNLVFPTGTNTTPNVWLTYDVIRKKWYQKDTGDADMPRCAFSVIDDDGVRYIYGGTDDGYLRRLDHGTTWDGIPIKQTIQTGDFFLTEDPWDESLIRYIRVMGKAINEDAVLTVSHIANTEFTGLYVNWMDTTAGTFLDTSAGVWREGDSGQTLISMDLTTDSKTIIDVVKSINLQAKYHKLKFSISTSDTEKGFQSPGFAIRGKAIRKVGP